MGVDHQRCGHAHFGWMQRDVPVGDARARRCQLVVARGRQPRRAHRRLGRVHAVDGGKVEGRDQQPVDDVGGAGPGRHRDGQGVVGVEARFAGQVLELDVDLHAGARLDGRVQER